MLNMKCFNVLVFILVTLRVQAQDIKSELNFFENIFNGRELKVVFKDSFDYYFNKSDDLVYSADGLIYACCLRGSTNKYSREYFQLEGDSSLLLLKKINLKDSSFSITFLKRNEIETITKIKRGCWENYLFKSEFDKNGFLLNVIIYENKEIIEPKKIEFK